MAGGFFHRCSMMVLHIIWVGDCISILTGKEESLLACFGGISVSLMVKLLNI